ncbi:MAG: hypothetical protein LBV51_04875 [Acholeplasmatales bacterium]|nr:hypothetical protein [Acholeplasmatales bacterium]
MKKNVLEDSIEFYKYGDFMKNIIIMLSSFFGLLVITSTVLFIIDGKSNLVAISLFVVFYALFMLMFTVFIFVKFKHFFSKIIIGKNGLKIVFRKTMIHEISWLEIKFVGLHDLIVSGDRIMLREWSFSSVDDTYLSKKELILLEKTDKKYYTFAANQNIKNALMKYCRNEAILQEIIKLKVSNYVNA